MTVPRIVRIADVVIDIPGESVRAAGGILVPLRPQSFRVLRHLLDNAGQLVGKTELMEAAWPNTTVTDDSLVQCIGDIRRALGDTGASFLKTVPRRGYRLDLPPQQAQTQTIGAPMLATASASTLAEAVAEPNPAPPSTGVAPRGHPSRTWTRGVAQAKSTRVAAGIVGIVALLALPILYVAAWPVATASGPASLAVVPLSGIGSDPSLGYLASGTTENLVTQLSRSPELRLIATPARAAGDAFDPAEIGRAVAADYVLFGSVQRDNATMRILAHLVDAESGEHLWAERFDRAGSDPFRLQDEVASKTLRTIAGEAGVIRKRLYEEAWGRDAGNLEEYDYFLRGHDIFMRFTQADNEEAMRIWTEGLERFPDSGILAVKAGYAYFMRLQLGWTRDRKADLEAAFALGRRGLAAPRQMPLGRTLAHMLMAEVHFYAHDFEAAMKERAFVLDLAPYDFFHRANLAYVAVGSGHPEEAVAALEGITPSHPLADFGYAALAWAHFARKDYAASIEAAGAALQPVPAYAYAFEAASHAELGDEAKAKAALAKLRAAVPSVSLGMIRDLHPNADAEVLEREVAALRRLGLPEVATAEPPY